MFNRSQDKWECDLNLTYTPFKLNRFRTTGPGSVRSRLHGTGRIWNQAEIHPFRLPFTREPRNRTNLRPRNGTNS